MILKHKDQIAYHRDRCLVNEFQPSVRDCLASKYERLNNKATIDFCGVVFHEGEISAFLPVGSSEQSNTSDIRLLLKSLGRYAAEKTAEDRWYKSGERWAESHENLSLIAVIFELLEDFRRNGLYSERHSSRATATGTPDWARTFKKVPYLSRSGRLVYPELATKVFLDSYSNLLSQIHNSVIREIADKYSIFLWDTGFRPAANLPPPALRNLHSPSNIKSLKQIKHSLFTVRSQRLLDLIHSYLTHSPVEADAPIPLGISRFEYMWEHMLKKTLSQKDDNMPDIPFGRYFADTTRVADRTGKLDIFLSDSSHGSVVDAKYYKAEAVGSDKHLPGWGDIVKQLYYAKTIGDVCPDIELSNWFVFPGTEQQVTSVKIIDPNTGNDAKGYQPIYCKYIDPSLVMKAYISGERLNDIRNDLLTSAIE
jgi:hypothetical protein